MTNTHVRKRVEPIVLLLDMDETLIGDITPQLTEYCIAKDINQRIKLQQQRGSKTPTVKYSQVGLQNELANYVIRPHLKKFLRNMSRYANVELFVYTASEDNWAKFLLGNIEKALKFKFNRPFLTRSNLHSKGYKSIERVRPLVFRSLKRKYNLKDSSQVKYITLIDNTRGILLESKYQIKCPSFSYIHQIDYLRNIPQKILIQYYPIIEKHLGLTHSGNLYQFYANYHNYLRSAYKNAFNTNKKEINDNYWYKFSKAFKVSLLNKSFADIINTLRGVA